MLIELPGFLHAHKAPQSELPLHSDTAHRQCHKFCAPHDVDLPLFLELAKPPNSDRSPIISMRHRSAASCHIRTSEGVEAHLWRRDVLVSSSAGALALAGTDLRRRWRRPLLKVLLRMLLVLLLVLVPEQVFARVLRQPARPEVRGLRPR